MNKKFREKKVNINNTSLFYSEIGSGKVVILIHGWMNSGIVWEKFARKLSMNYKVVIIDLPGFGKSICPYKENYINNTVLVLKSFFEKFEDEIYSIVGYSMGGQVLYELLKKNIVSPKKVVFCSTPIFGVEMMKKISKRDEYIEKLILFYKSMLKKDQLKPVVEKMEKIDFYNKIIVNDIQMANTDTAILMLDEIVNYKFEKIDISNINVLFIRGELDPLITKNEINKLFEFIDFRYIEIPKIAHLILKKSDEVERIVKIFLDRK